MNVGRDCQEALEDLRSEIDRCFCILRLERLRFFEKLSEDIRRHMQIEKRQEDFLKRYRRRI
jgi:hypothetical protein